jgi:DNA modification methylase
VVVADVKYLEDADFTLYCGDVLEELAAIDDRSVQTVITSPPYWGLRDYGTGSWEGGDVNCDHFRPASNFNAGFNERWGQGAGDRKQEQTRNGQYARVCEKCGAHRLDKQLGLEQTVHEYVDRLVAIFDEVRRVLRDDGTVWLNLGDSYAALRSYQVPDTKYERMRQNRGAMQIPEGLKPKDLIGVPWRVAFALQNAGWHLRADIIWHKPNSMPESVKDRPGKGHEYLFLLSKARNYYYDHEAVKEPAEWARWGDQTNSKHEGSQSAATWISSRSKRELQSEPTRNLRSVWSIPTQPYTDAHFATFPERLVELCLLAGCPEGGIVLDPFMGAGTVAYVARRLARKAVGIELNGDYCEQIATRTRQLSLLAQ